MLVLLCMPCACHHASAPPSPTGCPPRSAWVVWVVSPHSEPQVPPVHFAFGPPVDNYAGDFRRIAGELRLPRDLTLEGASGWFSVNIADLTMGDEDLDANVRDNVELLEGKRFPSSHFRFASIGSGDDRLRVGRATSVVLQGRLELKGVTIPLSVPGTMEVRAPGDGRSMIRLTCNFVIEQLRDRFGLLGPGGENEPAGDQVSVEVDVTLVPGEAPGAARRGSLPGGG